MSLLAGLRGQGQVPRDQSWVARQARDTARAAQEQLAQVGELTFATIRRGLLRILDGGGISVQTRRVDYTAGVVTDVVVEQLRLGALPDDPLFNRPDGSVQQAFVVRRDDGTTAFEVREGRANDGQYAQAWVFRDRSGAVVLAEDTNSGHGLASPHLPWPTPQPTNTAQWLTHSPAAGDTSWVSIARCEVDVLNPRMWWNVRTLVDAGVTAEYRWCWQLDGGVQAPVDRPHTLTGSGGTYAFGYWRETNVPLPSGVNVGDRRTLDLQVRMTAGTDGTHVAKAVVSALAGDQS